MYYRKSQSEDAFEKHLCLYSWMRLLDRKIHLKIIISQKMEIAQENYSFFYPFLPLFLPYLQGELWTCGYSQVYERRVKNCVQVKKKATQMHFNSSSINSVHMSLCLDLQIDKALDHSDGHLSKKGRYISPDDLL